LHTQDKVRAHTGSESEWRVTGHEKV
jgi:hypothetical protein